MGRLPRMTAKESIIPVVCLCVAAALAGCSASVSSSAGAPGPTAVHSAVHSAGATLAFTVAGIHPVLPNGSQDTHAQTPRASCQGATLASDHALGARVARGFALAGFAASAELLQHFLQGKGTEITYRAGSAVSKEVLATDSFRAVDNDVQSVVLSQLKAGRTGVRLSAAQLPTVAFESKTSDLYWGFRGTQGLAVTGSGHREDGRYVGTLSYVIRDSYGFPASDTLAGFGPPMRYLQTDCGAPQHPGGAHWFPDAIAVTVPFSRPA
jgi:hypothetical protein